MQTAILVKESNAGRLLQAALAPITSSIYTEAGNIEEEKVVLPTYGFNDKEFKSTLEQLLGSGKKLICLLQEYELSKWGPLLKERKITYIVNGIDSVETVHRFITGGEVDSEEQRRSYVFISATGGVGKSFLASYLAKRASEERQIRLVEWNYTSPSIYHYFGLTQKDADIVQPLKQLRNGMPYVLSECEKKIDKGLTLSLMSLNYFESTKWTVDHFTLLWDFYEERNEDAVLYEVPNFPFSAPAAVALMRGSDIVIPLVAEQNSIGNTLTLIKWLEMNRERNMPKIHLVVNRFDQEVSGMTIQDIEKTLGYPIAATIPTIKNLWNDFMSGDIFKGPTKETAKRSEQLQKMVESLGFHKHSPAEKKEAAGLIHKFFART